MFGRKKEKKEVQNNFFKRYEERFGQREEDLRRQQKILEETKNTIFFEKLKELFKSK